MASRYGMTDTPYIQTIEPLLLLVFSFIVALPPFVGHVLLHPFTYVVTTDSVSDRIENLRSRFFWYVYRVLGPIMDPKDRPVKIPLLSKAYGTVLEIGPGVGANIKYYKRSQVDRLVLVEPNTNMHHKIREAARQAGFIESDGSLLLLGCGGAASDERALALAGVGPESVDCIMSIHVLCGIPEPAQAVELYRKLLKRGGLLAFYEHVRSDQPFTANVQSQYTQYFWTFFFGGCCLDRPTGAWIMAGPDGAQTKELVTGKEMAHGINGINQLVQRRWSDYRIDAPKDQARYTLLPHVQGWAIKA